MGVDGLQARIWPKAPGCCWLLAGAAGGLLACPHVAFRLAVPVLPSVLLELIPRKGKAL